ncbi:KxYKxGKxW signal peptide domain-containing protein [Lacticaseibacillus pabuli]|uniref:KxYKxGKxW signal peptide domain-containing protein n=1 Tax=Lacticaseibacillus pabuli TaxID=3025672 RepID=A0ABY7WS27_9LACO|nr:KxYKxGKxW signal peptide domain-containing protein [Lacticaseibacillus sp. KACC 23028]WDF82921.1 KxYKxGKxW signal peptide domain-containing protein [Lacticaseibacillus sp. KACC 23028]
MIKDGQRLASRNMDSKSHYKMYKAGKNWLYAAILTTSIAAGAMMTQHTVAASTMDQVPAGEVEQTPAVAIHEEKSQPVIQSNRIKQTTTQSQSASVQPDTNSTATSQSSQTTTVNSKTDAKTSSASNGSSMSVSEAASVSTQASETAKPSVSATATVETTQPTDKTIDQVTAVGDAAKPDTTTNKDADTKSHYDVSNLEDMKIGVTPDGQFVVEATVTGTSNKALLYKAGEQSKLDNKQLTEKFSNYKHVVKLTNWLNADFQYKDTDSILDFIHNLNSSVVHDIIQYFGGTVIEPVEPTQVIDPAKPITKTHVTVNYRDDSGQDITGAGSLNILINSGDTLTIAATTDETKNTYAPTVIDGYTFLSATTTADGTATVHAADDAQANVIKLTYVKNAVVPIDVANESNVSSAQKSLDDLLATTPNHNTPDLARDQKLLKQAVSAATDARKLAISNGGAELVKSVNLLAVMSAECQAMINKSIDEYVSTVADSNNGQKNSSDISGATTRMATVRGIAIATNSAQQAMTQYDHLKVEHGYKALTTTLQNAINQNDASAVEIDEATDTFKQQADALTQQRSEKLKLGKVVSIAANDYRQDMPENLRLAIRDAVDQYVGTSVGFVQYKQSINDLQNAISRIDAAVSSTNKVKRVLTATAKTPFANEKAALDAQTNLEAELAKHYNDASVIEQSISDYQNQINLLQEQYQVTQNEDAVAKALRDPHYLLVANEDNMAANKIMLKVQANLASPNTDAVQSAIARFEEAVDATYKLRQTALANADDATRNAQVLLTKFDTAAERVVRAGLYNLAQTRRNATTADLQDASAKLATAVVDAQKVNDALQNASYLKYAGQNVMRDNELALSVSALHNWDQSDATDKTIAQFNAAVNAVYAVLTQVEQTTAAANTAQQGKQILVAKAVQQATDAMTQTLAKANDHKATIEDLQRTIYAVNATIVMAQGVQDALNDASSSVVANEDAVKFNQFMLAVQTSQNWQNATAVEKALAQFRSFVDATYQTRGDALRETILAQSNALSATRQLSTSRANIVQDAMAKLNEAVQASNGAKATTQDILAATKALNDAVAQQNADQSAEKRAQAKAAKERKEAKAAKERKEAKEAKERKEAKEAEERKEAKEAKERKEAKAAKERKEAKAAKERKEAKEAKERKESKEAEERKEAKEAKERKEAKAAKERKEAKAAKERKAAQAAKKAKAVQDAEALANAQAKAAALNQRAAEISTKAHQAATVAKAKAAKEAKAAQDAEALANAQAKAAALNQRAAEISTKAHQVAATAKAKAQALRDAQMAQPVDSTNTLPDTMGADTNTNTSKGVKTNAIDHQQTDADNEPLLPNTGYFGKNNAKSQSKGQNGHISRTNATSQTRNTLVASSSARQARVQGEHMLPSTFSKGASKSLPQTGDTENNTMTILGAIGLAATTLVGLTGLAKKREN